ncbi:MAG: hypothetical protein JW700_03320 [Candidatus Aenigmarchaeota archaeon]|nr:hypothetical protein [Candidatus Aenigmarchaeota archaeon]
MLESFAEILGIVVTVYGVMMAVANFPQAMKIIQKKSCDDVSITTYLILFPGTVFWILYGISISNFPVTFTNALSMISVLSVIVVYLIYRK